MDVLVCCQGGECSGAQGAHEQTSQDPVSRTEEEGENTPFWSEWLKRLQPNTDFNF